MKTNTTLPDDQRLLMGQLPSMSISQIAGIIRRDWKKVNYAAAPYVAAMMTMSSIEEDYFADRGNEVVVRFLCNAGSWRGPVAKSVKAELKRRAHIK